MGVSQLSEIVALGFEELIKEGDTREIGKFLAFPTERIIAPHWLIEVCNVATTSSPDDEEGQQEKYDRITSGGVRIQVKYRGGNTLHMEQTRRTTGKNATNGAKNGQVRYAVDSFDVILFIIPKGHEDISDWEYLAIPSYELEDKKMPGFCVGQVPASVRRKYQGRAKEVITNLENQRLQNR
tara:strand:- start:157 stop:702 length:546 start_codon:yes stop_codon:yes gene_type:complete